MINMQPLNILSPEKILIIKLRHHGDMLLVTPVIQTLHENYPDAQIDVLLFKETESMLSQNPLVNHCYVIDRKWKKLGLRQRIKHEWQLLKNLRQQRYQVVVNLADQWRSGLLTRVTGAKIRLGFDFPKRRGNFWQRSHTETVSVADHADLHTVQQNLSILAPLALDSTSTKATMSYLPDDQSRIEQLLAEHQLDASFIVIHPTSRWFFKCWPEHKMAHLINELSREGKKIIITASPDAKELAMVNKILTLCDVSNNLINLAGEISLPQLAALIDKAELFIGVDSVPMHMAAALKTPYIALFGPSKLKLWHPWEAEGEIIWAGDYGPLPDPDSIDTSIDNRYLDLIPVTSVLDSVRRLLK